MLRSRTSVLTPNGGFGRLFVRPQHGSTGSLNSARSRACEHRKTKKIRRHMDRLRQQVTPSDFAWEREGLAFVKERLPDHDPYRAWANFEFIATDGSINEVDMS
jgi:hypothetical protein